MELKFKFESNSAESPDGLVVILSVIGEYSEYDPDDGYMDLDIELIVDEKTGKRYRLEQLSKLDQNELFNEAHRAAYDDMVAGYEYMAEAQAERQAELKREDGDNE